MLNILILLKMILRKKMLRIIFILSTLHIYCYGFLRPAGRYEKPLRFETLYDTIVQTETVTYTEYSTCTKTALDIPLYL
ncbi:hypothetical protein Avbf_10521 [Armadillidium vulgare]|nr:hypothetical protein Avbf_10521 [Armadillidium vulgare]